MMLVTNQLPDDEARDSDGGMMSVWAQDLQAKRDREASVKEGCGTACLVGCLVPFAVLCVIGLAVAGYVVWRTINTDYQPAASTPAQAWQTRSTRPAP